MAFIDEETTKDVVVIMGTIFAFNSLPKFKFVGDIFESQPVLIFVLAIILIINSAKIAKRLGGKNVKQ